MGSDSGYQQNVHLFLRQVEDLDERSCVELQYNKGIFSFLQIKTKFTYLLGAKTGFCLYHCSALLVDQ